VQRVVQTGGASRLDRFELIAEIASGGMATVFLARLSGVAGFQRLVAIKRLHPHLAREQEFVSMFLDEARIAARIHHPNVVPIQEVGQSDQGYYLVMDYVEGDTLAHLLARASQAGATVPAPVALRILLDALAGLHAAHELVGDEGEPLGVVHRDVSPQNILVGADGVARVVDFGVARAASRLSTTRSGQLKGKLAYMAPEQARGMEVDRRTDVFACGVVLWEALALKRLFKGTGEADTLNRVLYEAIPAPSSVRPEVPPALEAVCMKALAREPGERYPTALALADALERAAAGQDGVATARDVEAFLTRIVGQELSDTREAVRSWLSRSEPDGSAEARRSKPALDSVVTRVDRERTGFTPGSSSRPTIERPPSGDHALPPGAERVSSVSSAAVATPSLTPGIARSRAEPAPRTGRVLALAVVALVAAGAWGARALAPGAPPASSPAAPPPSSAALPPGTATATSSSPVPAASATDPPPSAAVPASAASSTSSASVPAASASASASASARRPVAPVAPAVRPAPPRPPPDDLRNPYR